MKIVEVPVLVLALETVVDHLIEIYHSYPINGKIGMRLKMNS